MSNTIKLETNVPVTGTISKVWFQKSTKPDWSDQLKITGTWDGRGEGNVYVHTALESQMQQKGIIGARSGEAFNILGSNVRVQLLKKEENGKKFTDITLLSGGGNVNAGNAAPASGGGASFRTSNPIGDPKLYWAKLQLTFKSCLATARQMLTEFFNVEGSTAQVAIAQDAITRVATTLFEDRVRNGLLSSPPAPLADAALRSQIADGCVKLNQDENWLKAELLKVGCTDIAKLTAPEGQKVMAAIESAIKAKEEAEAAKPQQGQSMYSGEDIPF